MTPMLSCRNYQFHHRRLESLDHLTGVTYLYNSGILSTTVSLLDLKDTILFFGVSFFMCTFPVFANRLACHLKGGSL